MYIAYTGQLLIATTAGSGKAAKAYTVKQTLVPTGSGYTPSGFCSSLDFSPDGKSLAVGETGYLAGTEEGAVWVLQKTTGKSGWAFVAGPIMSTPANNGASLGFSVAITKTHLFSGAIGYVLPRLMLPHDHGNCCFSPILNLGFQNVYSDTWTPRARSLRSRSSKGSKAIRKLDRITGGPGGSLFLGAPVFNPDCPADACRGSEEEKPLR